MGLDDGNLIGSKRISSAPAESDAWTGSLSVTHERYLVM